MAREGVHYLIEYGNTGEVNAFVPIDADIDEYVRKFYPYVTEDFISTMQNSPEDGMWVKIIKTGYEDTHVFLPSGDSHTPSHGELMSMYVFFFNRDVSFMKKKAPR